jgi:CrcB protein
MSNYILVALGSAMGGMARYGCMGFVARHIGITFPWGTLFVNIAGSLVMGVLAALVPVESHWPPASGARALLMIGVCGGFTTFSSFSIETVGLARNGQWASAGSYVIGSFVLCVAAAAIGYFAIHSWHR